MSPAKRLQAPHPGVRRLQQLGAVVGRHLPVDTGLLVKTDKDRSRHLNRQLAWPLAFVAGAINAGGFLAIGFYTSHVTGSSSRAMDEAAAWNLWQAAYYGLIVVVYVFGAFSAATFIHLGKRSRFRSPYGGALFIAASLLIVFAMVAEHHAWLLGRSQLAIACDLSFFMGMLNAIATKITAAEVRVTHMTGVATDIGIELARLLYWNRRPRPKAPFIVANRYRLRLHVGTFAFFILGGLLGALGFRRIGFETVYPLAGLLFALSAHPVFYDLRIRYRLAKKDPRSTAWPRQPIDPN